MLKERLFRLGVDPRVVSSANGHTLLHAACGFGASKIAKLVVRRAVYESHPPFRAFLDKRANDGSAALDVATNAGFERIAEWLTALGASSGFEARLTPDRAGGDHAAARTNATTDPALYPPAFYPPAFAPAHVGVGIPGSHPPLPPSVDAYLFGALESVLGDLEGDESDESDESARLPRDALHNQTRERDDRARARRVGETRRRARGGPGRLPRRFGNSVAACGAGRGETREDAGRVTGRGGGARAGGVGGAGRRRAAEGGGAESGARRARFGGAEGGAHGGRARDFARGARRHRGGAGVRQGGDEDALLEHGTGGLPSRSVGRGGEELRDGDGDKLSRRRESIRDPGIRDPGSNRGGGGWETYRTPNADRATRVTTPRGLRRCWRCPRGLTRRGAPPARVRERESKMTFCQTKFFCHHSHR